MDWYTLVNTVGTSCRAVQSNWRCKIEGEFMEKTEGDYRITGGNVELLFNRGERFATVSLRTRDGKPLATAVPLMRLEIGDRMQERHDWVATYRVIACEQTDEHTLHVVVRLPDFLVTVGVWLRILDDGELSLILAPAEVEEQRRDLFRLYALEWLPGLMGAADGGRILLPLTHGLLIRPASAPAVCDRFLIYGEQERWELMPVMPLCGVSQAGGGWVALAVQGACDMYCGVTTDGSGGGTTGLYPMLRKTWVDPVDWTEREVRYSVLPPGTDLVHAAAMRLRRHVAEDLGKPTLAERAAESPVCAYQQRAYTMKIFHGIQRQGLMMRGREAKPDDLFFMRTLTFAAAEAAMKRLKAAGIERILFQSVGWNPGGHDGAWPTDFPIDRRLGGEEGLRAMVNTAKGLGYQITTHLNLVMSYFHSPDYQKDLVMHDIWGEPKVVGEWGGGIHAAYWGVAVPDAQILARLERLKDVGFNGMQYLDGMGNPLYMNYHPVHRGPRAHYAAGIQKFLKLAKSVYGGVQTEGGFLYSALDADALVMAGCSWHLKGASANWPITALLKIADPVPVWDLAMHAFVTLENQCPSWQSTMQSVLFGGVPRDEWTMEAGLFPVLDDKRIAVLKARYDLCCDRFGHLIPSPIDKWERLDAAVEKTVFGDGTEVVADFGACRLLVNGRDIERPAVLG